MASRGLGTLTLDLVAKIGGFEAGMDKAARHADKRMREIERRANAFGKALGAGIALAGTIIVAGLTVATKAAIDQADAIRDLSIRVGVGTETLSAYGYAASQTGTDIDALGKGLKILAKNAADALNPTSEQAKVFDALGIKVTDATGKLKNLDQLVPEIADKFKQLEDGTTKAALAQALFGKSGLELTEFLNQGASGLDTFTEKARALGIVIDEKTAAAADNFNDTVGDLKAAIGGLGLGIARELLPSLQGATSETIGLIKQGDLAAHIASVLGTAFSVTAGLISGYEKAVRLTTLAMENATAVASGWYEIQKNILSLGFADGSVADGLDRIRRQKEASDRERASILNPQKAAVSPLFITADTGQIPDSAFRNPGDSQARKSAADLEKRLALALSNPSAAKTKKAGKSDAEKEAEKLLAAYQRMESSYKEQIALVGDVTEVEKLRYELTNGEGAKFSEAQKSTLLGLAAQKDAQNADNKLTEEAKRLHESLITPMEAVNEARARAKELLDAGKISQDDYNRALKSQLTPTEEVLASIAEERDLLGATIEQQDTYNKLKYAGVDANSAWGRSIIEANQALHEQAKQMAASIEIQDEWRSGLSDAITDFVTGAKSLKEAFADFFDDFAAKITRMIAEKWIEQLFGEPGSNGGGSAGDGWAGIISSLFGAFGGGKAGGGSVAPGKLYEVGEGDRPEMLMMRGRQYMIPGNHGTVVPIRGSASGGQTLIFNNNYAAPSDPRTQQQLAARVAFESNRASARNR